MNARLLIIIVTYNGMKWIPRCLDEVRQQSIACDCIIYDNNSTDGTVAFIEQYYPEMMLISSKINLGFGRANNLGLEYAKQENYDYAFLLNQDAYLEPYTIKDLIAIQQLNPDFGVLSPVQYDGQGVEYDYKFKVLMASEKNTKIFNSAILPVDRSCKVYEVEFVMAAMWLMSIDCIRKVGEFDPIFQHYGEDNDYLNRARFHQFKVGIVDDCAGCHDRQSRDINHIKHLDVTFSSYLAVLTNLNLKTRAAIWKVLINLCKHTRNAITGADLKYFTVVLKKSFALLVKSPQIISTRRKNRLAAEML